MNDPVCPHCENPTCCAVAASERRRLRSILKQLVEWDRGKPYPGSTPVVALKEIINDATELIEECP